MSQKVIFPYVKLLTQCMSNPTGVNEHVFFFFFFNHYHHYYCFFFVYKHDSVVKKLTFLSTHLQAVLIPGLSYFMKALPHSNWQL